MDHASGETGCGGAGIDAAGIDAASDSRGAVDVDWLGTMNSFMSVVPRMRDRGGDARTRRRTGLWLVLAGLILAAAAANLLGCAPSRSQAAPESVLEACSAEDGPADALCGRVEVYEDRVAGTGRRIALKVVVLRALSRDARPDPLFLLAGGPGQAATEVGVVMRPVLRAIQKKRDIVLVDQRGTGSSNPLDCELSEEQSATAAFPEQRLKECLAGYDADPGLYTTPLAMDDLDDVRERLAYERINLWGGSYGTRAALVYLRRHPGRVRTVILDGVAPVDMKLPLSFAADGQRSLNLLLDGCEAQEECRSAFPDLRGRIEALLASLEAQPRTVRTRDPRTGEPRDVTMDRERLAMLLRVALYDPRIASLLPLMLTSAEQDDFGPLLTLSTAAAPASMSIGLTLSVVCAEDLPFVSAAERESAWAGTFLRAAAFDSFSDACQLWPRGVLPAGYHDPVVAEHPVLILSGELDPATPPRWGDKVARHLSGSRHVVVPGVGHGTWSQGCVPNLMARFIERGSAAGLETTCVAELRRPPFFLSQTGPLARDES